MFNTRLPVKHESGNHLSTNFGHFNHLQMPVVPGGPYVTQLPNRQMSFRKVLPDRLPV